MKIVGVTDLGALWALEWAWHAAETNVHCVRSLGICVPNLNRLDIIVFEILAFIRTDRQTDMARSTRLVILINNLYTLWGRKRCLLPVTYFPTTLLYHFTLRETGIPCKHFLSRKALLSDFKKMKTIVRDIAFGSRKWLPSGRNVPLRRHFSKSLLRYFWKCRRSHSWKCRRSDSEKCRRSGTFLPEGSHFRDPNAISLK